MHPALGIPDAAGAVRRMGAALKAKTNQFAANVLPIIREVVVVAAFGLGEVLAGPQLAVGEPSLLFRSSSKRASTQSSSVSWPALTGRAAMLQA
jgi:hypothetical protein